MPGERVSPRQQFAGYLSAKEIDDERLVTLFDELHDEATQFDAEVLDAP